MFEVSERMAERLVRRALKRIGDSERVKVYLYGTDWRPLFCDPYGDYCVMPFEFEGHPFSGFRHVFGVEFFRDLYALVLRALEEQDPDLFKLVEEAGRYGAKLVFKKPVVVEVPRYELLMLIEKYAGELGRIKA